MSANLTAAWVWCVLEVRSLDNLSSIHGLGKTNLMLLLCTKQPRPPLIQTQASQWMRTSCMLEAA